MRCLLKIAMLVIAIIFFGSCTKSLQEKTGAKSEASLASKKDQEQKFNTFYGPQVKLGRGKTRSFATISHTGVPLEVGVEISAAALSGLPSQAVNLVLPLHNKASNTTPFNHVYMNWNPHGHPPFPGPYLVPHFDFHFYMISNTDRVKISHNDPKIDAVPNDPSFIPDNYIATPGGEDQMGKHWIDSKSPEICCNKPFTHTMIYGSYDSKFIFIEPMITLEFLSNVESSTVPFSPLKQFIVPNSYYPSAYKMYKTDGNYIVSLTAFQKH